MDGPCAVINADDFYGRNAFRIVYDYLAENEDDDKYRCTMAGCVLGNTLTDNGYVARGVCELDENGFLTEINERKHIEKTSGGAAYTEDEGKTWTDIPTDSVVSMNMWGFSAGILRELKERFPSFLDAALRKDPEKAEYFLPSVVDQLLKEEKATVSVRMTPDKWYGVTYKEDREDVASAIALMEEQGLYPEDF